MAKAVEAGTVFDTVVAADDRPALDALHDMQLLFVHRRCPFKTAAFTLVTLA